jgi:dihydrofolate reductase
MRKLTSSLFISLDGVVESPDQWTFDHFDDGMMSEMQSLLAQQDTVLMGRVTYDDWAGYWPTATDEPFASYINNIPKFVVTSRTEPLTWQNSTRLEGDLTTAITALKQQPGNNIGVTGSPTLVLSLLELGLLDMLQLTLHPVVAGKGRRLFKDNGLLQRLELLESKTTPSGVAILNYGLRSA